jgi:peroxiredoxin
MGHAGENIVKISSPMEDALSACQATSWRLQLETVGSDIVKFISVRTVESARMDLNLIPSLEGSVCPQTAKTIKLAQIYVHNVPPGTEENTTCVSSETA